MLGINKLQIEFIPASKEAEDLVPYPRPAKLYIPDWYKSIKPLSEPDFFDGGAISNQGLKECVPFLDALTHGYIQESWTDIYIKNDNGMVSYYYQTGPEIISSREHPSVPFFQNLFYNLEFVWKEQWIPKLPKGYSVLYTSPLNNLSLPFKCLDAIIDADYYHHEYNGQYPFYMYKNFTGLIPAGTPLYQIIPIKRENWKSVANQYNEKENKIKNNQIRKYYFKSYKKQFWQKKGFE